MKFLILTLIFLSCTTHVDVEEAVSKPPIINNVVIEYVYSPNSNSSDTLLTSISSFDNPTRPSVQIGGVNFAGTSQGEFIKFENWSGTSKSVTSKMIPSYVIGTLITSTNLDASFQTTCQIEMSTSIITHYTPSESIPRTLNIIGYFGQLDETTNLFIIPLNQTAFTPGNNTVTLNFASPKDTSSDGTVIHMDSHFTTVFEIVYKPDN